MRPLFIPQAPGIAGRPMSAAEMADLLDHAQWVDRVMRRVGRDVSHGVRVLLASMATGYATRGVGQKL